LENDADRRLILKKCMDEIVGEAMRVVDARLDPHPI
jgi:hypothetical protein